MWAVFMAALCLGVCMRLVKVNQAFYELCKENGVDGELLQDKDGRPCVLLVTMKYKEKDRDFVIPLRSNISGKTNTREFKSLPPNKNTRKGNRHGIHYTKMFPVSKDYIETYLIDQNDYLSKVKAIIDRSEKEIIKSAKDYLYRYENGRKHPFAPDIDGIIKMLDDRVNNIVESET